MIRKKLALLVLATGVLTACALVFGSTGAEGKPKTPKRVLIVLFDQMRPEYADRFDMPTYRSLRDAGTNFEDAYLGYMGSETVIAHNVIVSGQEPRHMGWVDEAYRDADNVLGFGANAMHITGDLPLADFTKLVDHEGYPKLSDYLQARSPGTKFIAVGEKSYAVESIVAGGDPSDIAVRMSSRRPTGECVAYPTLRMRRAVGQNVPAYLTAFCGRYYINSTSGPTNDWDYGTLDAFPSWMYPEEADRMFPGTDTTRLGGDVWVADAAMEMMEKENWSGMFVSLGGIDKAGHMWGADQDSTGHDCSVGTGQVHVDCAAKIADQQLKHLLDKLEALGQLDETLVVLTADHGATHGATFYGKTTSGAGDSNWYYDATGAVFDGGGQYAPFGTLGANLYRAPSPGIAAFNTAIGGNLQFSYQSTSIQAWLIDNSKAKQEAAAAAMLNVPGVIASYRRHDGHFHLAGKNAMTPSEEKWWKKTAKDIVDTMAADNGPDVVGLLHDDTSYGVYGDHGGASEEVQRVPMVFWTADDKKHGKKDKASKEHFNTPDVMPTILKELDIKLTHKVDGHARNVK